MRCRNTTAQRQWHTKGLFQSLKYIYGPKKNATVPVFCLDGKTLLNSIDDKKELWTEHFTQLLSETTTVSDSVIRGISDFLEHFVSWTFADVSGYYKICRMGQFYFQ